MAYLMLLRFGKIQCTEKKHVESNTPLGNVGALKLFQQYLQNGSLTQINYSNQQSESAIT